MNRNKTEFLEFLQNTHLNYKKKEYLNKGVDIILISNMNTKLQLDKKNNFISMSLHLKNKDNNFEKRFTIIEENLTFIFSNNFIDLLKRNNINFYYKVIDQIRFDNKFNHYLLHYSFLKELDKELNLYEIKLFESSLRLKNTYLDIYNIDKIRKTLKKIIQLFFPMHNIFFF